MVLASPPEGWVLPRAEGTETFAERIAVARSGPPPLSKVSQTYLTLELEPDPSARWKKILDRSLRSPFVWGGGVVALCLFGFIAWMGWGGAEQTDHAGKPTSSASEAPTLIAQAKGADQASDEKRSPASDPLPNPKNPPQPSPDDSAGKNPDPSKTPSNGDPIASVAEKDRKSDETIEEPKADSVVLGHLNPDSSASTSPKTAEKTAEPKDRTIEKPSEGRDEKTATKSEDNSHAQESAKAETSASTSEPSTVSKEESELALSPSARWVKPAVPEDVDVEMKLTQVISGIELQDIPLVRALAMVTSFSTVPITLDADVMVRWGVSPADPISLTLNDVTVEKLLGTIAEQRGMAVEVENHQLILTVPKEQQENYRTVRYAVADLGANEKETAELAALIQNFVAASTWQSHGGSGTMKVESGLLSISQSGDVHRQIIFFCEKLRLARGLPLRSKLDKKLFQPVSPSASIKPAIQKLVSANFRVPSPLSEIVQRLGDQAGVTILLDHRALAEAGMSGKNEVSFAVANRPLEIALNELLLPLKLSYRPIDAHTLEVSTPKSLNACEQWQIYPVERLLDGKLSGADLLVQIRESVSPASWAKRGGRGTVALDPSGHALVVLNSPGVQAEIYRYLTEKSSEPKENE